MRKSPSVAYIAVSGGYIAATKGKYIPNYKQSQLGQNVSKPVNITLGCFFYQKKRPLVRKAPSESLVLRQAKTFILPKINCVNWGKMHKLKFMLKKRMSTLRKK